MAKRDSSAPSGRRTRKMPSKVSSAGLKKVCSTVVMARSSSMRVRTCRRWMDSGKRASPRSPGLRAPTSPRPEAPLLRRGSGQPRPPVQSSHSTTGCALGLSTDKLMRSPAWMTPRWVGLCQATSPRTTVTSEVWPTETSKPAPPAVSTLSPTWTSSGAPARASTQLRPRTMVTPSSCKVSSLPPSTTRRAPRS